MTDLQLDQRLTPAANLHEQSFALAITKHGLFGDDALGLSFSRPAPSLAGSLAGLLPHLDGLLVDRVTSAGGRRGGDRGTLRFGRGGVPGLRYLVLAGSQWLCPVGG